MTFLYSNTKQHNINVNFFKRMSLEKLKTKPRDIIFHKNKTKQRLVEDGNMLLISSEHVKVKQLCD